MTLRGSRRRPRAGLALIVVLVVLALLCLLGVWLATNSTLERRVSLGYLDTVRARLVARAGVETAIGHIQGMVQRGELDSRAMQYWGSMVNEEGTPDWQTPLEKAVNPSYAVEDEPIQNPEDPNTRPLALTMDDETIGISGTMTSSSHGIHSDVFRLRVGDCNSRIFVNDGIEEGNIGGVSKNLARLLDALGDIVGVSGAGLRLIERRPPGGYHERAEIQEVLGKMDYKRIAPFLTLHAWVDKSVVNPVPLSAATLDAYPVDYNERLGLYRYGRPLNSAGASPPLLFRPDFSTQRGFGHVIAAFDEISPQWIGRSGRAPVNVNAASEEVLTALLVGLRGWFWVEPRGPTGLYGSMRTTNQGPGLFATQEIDRVTATMIAKEITACRTRRRSMAPDGLDYGSAWYGGPFRTWRQFHAFCDSLVERKVLEDDRRIFTETVLTPMVAAQAMADVLKANFNPNCTLNELNPDRNLFLVVDKTDLICNSTEFCFTPMGYFDIESEGLVIETRDGKDLFKERQGRLRARARTECAVKVFDVLRETTQADFSRGDLGAPLQRRLTNSNRALETGPEPANGPGPNGCEWSGWIQLSTLGGIQRQGDPLLPMATPAGGSSHGAVAHAHFQFDHRLNHHAGGDNDAVHGSGMTMNQADRTEPQGGPYGPADGKLLARDWKTTERPADAGYHAQSDLRIDGAYIERDAACMYVCEPAVFDLVGTVCYWIKPSFRPELSAYARTYFCSDTIAFSPSKAVFHGQWFAPGHDRPAFQQSRTEHTFPRYPGGPIRPCCFMAGFSTPGGGSGTMTPTLNHQSHQGCEGPDYIKHHEWVHVAYSWDMPARKVQMRINGRALGGMGDLEAHPGNFVYKLEEWTAPGALMRIGNPGRGSRSGPGTSDSTVDEFHLWKGDNLEAAITLFEQGRYHIPRSGYEASFTSGPLLTQWPGSLRLPPASGLTAPGGSGGTQVKGVERAPPKPEALILAVAWTWYPERVDREGNPMALDQLDELLHPVELRMRLLVNETEIGDPLTAEGGGPLPVVAVRENDQLQYRLEFRIPGAQGSSILLGTPAIDDVTILYSTGIQVFGGGTGVVNE